MTYRDNRFRVLDLGSGNTLHTSAAGPMPLRFCHFDPTGKWLAVASEDTTVEVWDWENQSLRATLRWHDSRVIRARWSPAGNRLLAVAAYQAVVVHDLEARVPFQALSVLEKDSNAYHTSMGWSGDGRTVMVSDIGQTEFWDTHRGVRNPTMPPSKDPEPSPQAQEVNLGGQRD